MGHGQTETKGDQPRASSLAKGIRQVKIQLCIRKRRLPTLAEGNSGVPARQRCRTWRTRVHLMQFIEESISTSLQVINGIFSNTQVRDQRKIFFTQQPEVRRSLPMPLGKHTKVVTLGIGIHSKKQK